MNLRLKRTPGIYLVGFAGARTGAVGRLLSQRLGWNFVDLENDAAFDRLQQTCRSIERGRPSVVALSESAFAEAADRDLALRHGLVFWVDCNLEMPPEREEALRAAFALADVRIAVEAGGDESAADAIAAHPILL